MLENLSHYHMLIMVNGLVLDNNCDITLITSYTVTAQKFKYKCEMYVEM